MTKVDLTPSSPASNPGPNTASVVTSSGPPVILQLAPARTAWQRLRSWLLWSFLLGSIFLNLILFAVCQSYFELDEKPGETYHSGDKDATDKIAMLEISGTIMPPFTDRTLKAIKAAKEDPAVKAVLLRIDSPGGFVADSHQIYHRLLELAQAKPMAVSLGSYAASGGYYVAMGAGPKSKIFAEPTTWTGSIGVIIPRYEVSELAEKVGVKAAPLKTGPFKDALSPFHPLTPEEQEIWRNILDQSFDRFLTVIDNGRATLDKEQVRKLATGQIYTADDALKLGMIDAIGYEDDAIAHLKQETGLTRFKVIHYSHPGSALDLLLSEAQAKDPRVQWDRLLGVMLPRAMYYPGPVSPAAAQLPQLLPSGIR